MAPKTRYMLVYVSRHWCIFKGRFDGWIFLKLTNNRVLWPLDKVNKHTLPNSKLRSNEMSTKWREWGRGFITFRFVLGITLYLNGVGVLVFSYLHVYIYISACLIPLQFNCSEALTRYQTQGPRFLGPETCFLFALE